MDEVEKRMTQASGGNGQRGKAGDDEKQARLAEALRANLRRRKAQSAARKDLPESDDAAEDGAPENADAIARKNDQ